MDSIVGLAVLRIVAPNIRLKLPSLASVSVMSSGSSSVSRAPSSVLRNSLTVGVNRSGHWWLPIRVTASTRFVTALSLFTIEPCPAVPRAFRRIQFMPFSAVSIRYSRWSSLSVTENPPTSPIPSVQSAIVSGWFLISH